MASTTDTIPDKTGTTAHQASRPTRGRHGALTWAAVIGSCSAVAALAVATLLGGDDGSDSLTTRLSPQAEVYERQAHLEGQARTYGRDTAATAPSPTGNRAALIAEAERIERQAHLEGQARTYGGDSGAAAPSPTGNRAALIAEAERIEHQAHLEGEARTYGQHPAGTPTPTTEGDAPEPEFLPGSRRVPTR